MRQLRGELIGLATRLVAFLVVASVALSGSPAGAQGERYGVVDFPRDEHVHLDGWDFWWGAADLLASSGSRYTLGIAYASLNGYGLSGHQLFAWQGPYRGLTVATQYGPNEWGHPAEPPGRYLRRTSAYVPGQSELLRLETIDAYEQGRSRDVWERTSLADHIYRFALDDDAARIHPSGATVRFGAELTARMRRPPLLAGGDGRFWYGVPQSYGYPSRSWQYMQGAEELSGWIEVGQPDGTVLRETIDPSGSKLVMTHEYDATPEDLPAGLTVAILNEMHPRFPLYYQGGMPWELLFLDLGNGAQLFLALVAFQDADRGILDPLIGGNMDPYRVFATLRLPTGESIALDEKVKVEHLSYRLTIGRVPTFMTFVQGIWKQAWTYRVRYDGGDAPPFDLGIASRFAPEEPLMDAQGKAQRQRVPFVATGAYGGCPVSGFGWSEVIINWYRYESEDPWFTGGQLPEVPAAC